MEITMIVAMGKNNEIGAGGKLLWHLPSDLKFFKEKTIWKSVIMGRKTFESLLHALPNRQNIVITSQLDYAAKGATVVPNCWCAILMAATKHIFIIGGASIYKQFLPRASSIYCTKVDAEFPEADTFFPEIDPELWEESEIESGEENGLKYTRVLYTRVRGDLYKDV